MGDRPTALAVSPHPDDELIPAGGTLIVLRDAGWRIVNLACSLGRPEQQARRRHELERACDAAGFELELVSPPVALSRADDLDAARARLESAVGDRLRAHDPCVVLAPGPADRHHAHELVARAVVRAVTDAGTRRAVWWWELWGQLEEANLLVRVDAVLERVCSALQAHREEIARNDYLRLVRARAAEASVLGPERVFGYGRAGVGYDAAEILCETIFAAGRWQFAPARELDIRRPAVAAEGRADASAFVTGHQTSGGGSRA